LFSSYFFTRIEDRWRPIERVLGVAGLVKFGDKRAKCPDAEIAKLIARSDPDGVVRLALRPSSQTGRSGLAPGAKVLVVSGPVRGFNAIYAGNGGERAGIDLVERARRSAAGGDPPASSRRAKAAERGRGRHGYSGTLVR
jgi:transcription antitermination factor NusG